MPEEELELDEAELALDVWLLVELLGVEMVRLEDDAGGELEDDADEEEDDDPAEEEGKADESVEDEEDGEPPQLVTPLLM